jgi:hypothetical protein
VKEPVFSIESVDALVSRLLSAGAQCVSGARKERKKAKNILAMTSPSSRFPLAPDLSLMVTVLPCLLVQLNFSGWPAARVQVPLGGTVKAFGPLMT